MEFKEFRTALQKHFKEMSKDVTTLFEVSVDKDELWNLYLDSFPAGTNEIYRERREYDCSCCRHFIKSFGNVVTIKNGEVHTIWELNLNDGVFQVVSDALNKYILDHVVTDVYLTKESKIGTDYSTERIEDKIIRYDHFYLELPSKFVFNRRDTIDTIKGQYRDTKNVFKRSLDEITEESVETVLELISQNSLYKGKEWESVLREFLKYQKEYNAISENKKDLYAWEKSISAGMVIGRIRNHSMGTLLVDISGGMELDTAVKKYEAKVAPANYKRPKAIFTKKMLEDAQKTIAELGYMDSLKRRFATLDDITVNNILFVNRDSAKRVSGAMDLFAEMEKDVSSKPKTFSKVEEIGIEDFVKNVLPIAKEVEAYFDNTHVSNMVSLIAPEVTDSKTMFKWNNNFSWAYTGNMTDSMMKERVKAAGGKVDGVLRFSIQWNDTSEYSRNDLDAHCQEPAGGTHIYFGSNARKPGRSRLGGQLDVDITGPVKGVPAVENITWPDRSEMAPGVYKFWVHQFSNRGGRDGFRAEIEFDGQIYSFDYDKELRQGENVMVAEVTLSKDGKFSIKELLPSTTSSKEVWGIKTNQFIPVSVVCYSPNYWDEQTGIGHKHYFFMLKDCVNTEQPNGYYNEFLKPELEKHKRVFEALGAKAHVADVNDQLSGLGFSSTKRAELIVKVKGATERVVKIKF
jgi:hypothetical protein